MNMMVQKYFPYTPRGWNDDTRRQRKSHHEPVTGEAPGKCRVWDIWGHHTVYPENLQALTPEFYPAEPHPPFGQYRHRRSENGQFYLSYVEIQPGGARSQVLLVDDKILETSGEIT